MGIRAQGSRPESPSDSDRSGRLGHQGGAGGGVQGVCGQDLDGQVPDQRVHGQALGSLPEGALRLVGGDHVIGQRLLGRDELKVEPPLQADFTGKK